MLSFRNAFAIFESAIRDGHASRQQIIDYCDEPYVGRKRELAISVAQHAIGISENGGESFCLATMIEEGVALPTQQVEFVHPVSGERRRADYVWHTEDGRTIVGELDGQDKYVNPTMTGGHTISPRRLPAHRARVPCGRVAVPAGLQRELRAARRARRAVGRDLRARRRGSHRFLRHGQRGGGAVGRFAVRHGQPDRSAQSRLLS